MMSCKSLLLDRENSSQEEPMTHVRAYIEVVSTIVLKKKKKNPEAEVVVLITNSFNKNTLILYSSKIVGSTGSAIL